MGTLRAPSRPRSLLSGGPSRPESDSTRPVTLGLGRNTNLGRQSSRSRLYFHPPRKSPGKSRLDRGTLDPTGSLNEETGPVSTYPSPRGPGGTRKVSRRGRGVPGWAKGRIHCGRTREFGDPRTTQGTVPGRTRREGRGPSDRTGPWVTPDVVVRVEDVPVGWGPGRVLGCRFDSSLVGTTLRGRSFESSVD